MMETTYPKVCFSKDSERLFKTYPNFLDNYNKLQSTIKKVFIRSAILKSPRDRVVFYLGRLCIEDFNEVFLLAANGYGFGALKILRSLYERTVTSAYISKSEDDAILFLDYHYVHKKRMLTHAKDFFGTIEDQVRNEEVEHLKLNYDRVKHNYDEIVCNQCNKSRMRFSWSKLDLLSMAKKAGYGLDKLYFPGYFFPTLQSHATASSLMSRLIHMDNENVKFDEESQPEWADRSLVASQDIVFRLLAIQNDYFNLSFDDEIQERIDDFSETWSTSN